ncbi:MAG TPA: hypothetical protein VGJ26_13435, partial [Pirellulales bacterium]
MRRANSASWLFPVGLLALVAVIAGAVVARGEGVIMLDGRVMEGKLARIPSMTNKQKADPHQAVQTKNIYLCDDGLHRYFFPTTQTVRNAPLVTGADTPERFILKNQGVATTAPVVTSVGVYTKVTPFDEFGKRKISTPLGRKQATVYQGITEITPTWTKVEALAVKDSPSYVWDQRIATNSIPHELLDKILRKQIDPKNVEQRLKIVRLYIQMERYNEARADLLAIIKDFPDRKEDFSRTERELRQRYALRALSEIKNRRDAGQHQLALAMLEQFPTQGMPGEVLAEVSSELQRTRTLYADAKALVDQLGGLMDKAVDRGLVDKVKSIRDEMQNEMTFNTLQRLSAFKRLADDPKLTPDEKISLAITGWLLGADEAVTDVKACVTLVDIRDQAR